MITVTLTLGMLKWAGLGLFILSLCALFFGNLPDHYGNPVWNASRYILWPLFLVWCLFFFVRGVFF